MADEADNNNAQLPLKGVVLCCTSLTQDARTKAAEVSTQMGAVHKLDLTSDVTHLIVGSIATPKYRYVAKDRPDIKVLSLGWLEAVREAWMEGGDVDVFALETEHKLGTFYGLNICVTGFEDMERRNFISDTAEQHGARYHGDLTKIVTHLICAAPQGAKYTHAKQWGIPTVSFKWFEDSLLRGMTLDESLYEASMPPHEQGKGAFRVTARPRISLGKRPRDDESQASVAEEPGRRKLRRTASARLSSQSQDMWQDISAGGDANQPAAVDQWADGNADSAHSRPRTADHTSVDRLSIDRSVTMQPEELSQDGLFTGWHAHLHGFDTVKTNRLRHVLELNGAKLVDVSSQLEDASYHPLFKGRCLLVPHAAPDSSVELPDVPPGTVLVTEWWVERCLHYKRSIDPEDDALSIPIWNKRMDSSFTKLTICTTGFQGTDLRQAAKAVQIAGATYNENLVPGTSVLVCATESVRKEKGMYASKHGIPVVSAEWLWACFKSGKNAPLEKFKIRLPAYDGEGFGSAHSSNSPAPTEMAERKSSMPPKCKDEPKALRLSNMRKTHATPSLPLQAQLPTSAPNVKTLSKRPQAQPQPQPQKGPGRRAFFVEETDDNDMAISVDNFPQALTPTAKPLSPRTSQPLQEMSPNRSPRKGSQSQDKKSAKPNISMHASEEPSAPISVSHSTTDPGIAAAHLAQDSAVRPQEELTANLQSLLARQASSRPASAATNNSNPAPPRRKHKPLGRATSGLSNRSLSASAQSDRASSNPHQHQHLDQDHETASDSKIADGFAPAKAEPAMPPSTQLGYEAPGAEQHRRQVCRSMGLKSFEDESGGKREQKIGVVKDAEVARDVQAGSGIGGRVRGKARLAKGF